jgi:hypothetical protein
MPMTVAIAANSLLTPSFISTAVPLMLLCCPLPIPLHPFRLIAASDDVSFCNDIDYPSDFDKDAIRHLLGWVRNDRDNAGLYSREVTASTVASVVDFHLNSETIFCDIKGGQP